LSQDLFKLVFVQKINILSRTFIENDFEPPGGKSLVVQNIIRYTSGEGFYGLFSYVDLLGAINNYYIESQ